MKKLLDFVKFTVLVLFIVLLTLFFFFAKFILSALFGLFVKVKKKMVFVDVVKKTLKKRSVVDKMSFGIFTGSFVGMVTASSLASFVWFGVLLLVSFFGIIASNKD